MPSFERSDSKRPRRNRTLFLGILAGITIAAGTADAACRQPRMTGLSEKNGPNCGATGKCGFVIAHWAGAEGCDHYNIRERSGTQFEAPGTNRNQLHNQRSAQFPANKFGSNNTIFVRAQGCTRNIFGKSSCTGWSNEVSLDIQPMASAKPPDAPAKGKWGALAADGKGRWGFAVNQPTQWAAQYQARKGCGAQACTVRISAPVGCYAYFESRSGGYWYGLALHSSGATALQVARGGCEKGAPAGTCKLVKANCGS